MQKLKTTGAKGDEAASGRVALMPRLCHSGGITREKACRTMPRSGIWIFLCAAILAPAAPAVAANLTIRVDNVSPAGGILRLGLYDQASYPNDEAKPIASADVPAVAGETVVTLRNIPPGTYAIQAFQDVNSNDKMDTSWVGLPLEPFGFSRDAVPFLSKPSFDEVKFTVLAGENSQLFHLQNSVRNNPADKARDTIRARQRK
ncbi:MAG: DUF2141 domain-containing protein [Alphaproteobacteria bacterium]|nr:DUF2141 domain-containing protein [Alphaproteobacteria bacterium]